MEFLASVDGFLGTVWWTALVFVVGALLGTPLWGWLKDKLPWGK